MAKMKHLRLIATRSTGFNHINVKEARRRITVVNVPYCDENTVAEHTFALILSLSRNILMKMENVILTPHMGFDRIEAVKRILLTTVENIVAFDRGTPQYVVAAE